MSKEKQILQMLKDGYSQRRIASTLCVSRNTVAKVAKAASDLQLSKDALESMDSRALRTLSRRSIAPNISRAGFSLYS